MDNLFKDIAQRLKGLRDALDLSSEEMASYGGITEEQYNKYESGEIDIPVSVMHQICQKCGIDISEVLTGESPHNSLYSVTYANKGTYIERNSEYSYQALTSNFKGKRGEPYHVIVNTDKSPNSPTNKHDGQEFNYILEGKVELMLGNKKIILGKGDSIFFNSSVSHGLKALGNENAELLVIIM